MNEQRPVISQIQLISAITKEMKSQNPDINIDLPMYNVILSAANLVCDESARERVYATMPMTRQEWLESDDTGLSSKFLCGVITGPEGLLHSDGPLPCDFADLGRCVRMVRALGGHEYLHRLSQCEPGWVRIGEHWSIIEAWYDERKAEAVYDFLHSTE
ncbi:hypothetical protein AB6D11_01025 [Vibrio splendidus]